MSSRFERARAAVAGAIAAVAPASLTGAEAQAALDCLLDGWPGLALGVEPERLKWIPRSGLRGLKQLPVIFG